MHVDDPVAKCLEERRRVHAVIAGVDDELNSVLEEEVAHRRVALLDRCEPFLRQLRERDAPLARERGAYARRPVGGNCDHVEPAVDQVAEVGALTGDADT